MPLLRTIQNYEPQMKLSAIPFSFNKPLSKNTSVFDDLYSIYYGRQPIVLCLLIKETIPYREEETSLFLKTLKDVDLLDNFFTLNNKREIRGFLFSHKHLICFFFEIYNQIERVFGQNKIETLLEYDRDPEEDFEGLSIIIKTDISPDISLQLLEKFDEEYWLNVDNEIRKILNITVMPI